MFSQWYQTGNFSAELFGKQLALNCAEQGMMAGKALFFNDEEAFDKIMRESNPSGQKALGKTVKNFDVETWNNVAKDIVFNVNLSKFTSDEKLRKYIISTGDKHLVEASPYDAIWGVKLAVNDPRVNNPANWRGTNWLGEVLMEVRDCVKVMK